MKINCASGVRTLRRPIAVMLALLPAGALAFSYCVVQWASMMTANGRITNPDLAMTIEGFGTLFREYAIPVLILSLVLALVNLWCAFAVRTREGGACLAD
jgi:NADH:ubiquinone oxidoreductase subunit 6 (subunit J)